MRLSASASSLPQLLGLRRVSLGFPRSCSVPAGTHKSPITSKLWAERAAAAKAEGDSSHADAPAFLLTKAPSESAVSVDYNFKSDPVLRDRYRNATGGVRFGDLFEDMDALAGNVSFKHADDGNPATRPLLLVTASVDQIQRVHPIDVTPPLILDPCALN